MRLCTECTENSEAWSHGTAPPGRCGECGRAFDVQGVPIADESVTCPLHEPILASCPHTSEERDVAPAPAVSWLAEDTGSAGGGEDAASPQQVR